MSAAALSRCTAVHGDRHGLGLVLIALAEFVGAKKGLGYMIRNYSSGRVVAGDGALGQQIAFARPAGDGRCRADLAERDGQSPASHSGYRRFG
jgi:hypothetical protein